MNREKKFRLRLFKLSKHLTTEDQKKIKLYYGKEIGAGEFEENEINSAISLLDFLVRNDIIRDGDNSLKELFDKVIMKPYPLAKEYTFKLEYTCGPVCVLSTEVEIKAAMIRSLEYKITDDNRNPQEWAKIEETNFKIIPTAKETYVNIENLLVETGHCYAIRLLLDKNNDVNGNEEDDDKVSITCYDIKAFDEGVCGWIKRNPENYIINVAHNNGTHDNIHLFDTTKLVIREEDKCKPIQKGASMSVRTIADFRSLARDYGKLNATDTRRFLPSYMIRKGCVKKVGDMLQGMCDMGDVVITGYSCSNHLMLLGYDTKKLTGSGFHHLNKKSAMNSVILLNVKQRLILVTFVLENSSDIKEALMVCDESLRAISSIFKDLIEKHHIALVGSLVLPEIERRALTHERYPFVNVDDFQDMKKEGILFITKDEMSSGGLKVWWNRLSSQIRNHRRDAGAIKFNVNEMKPIFLSLAGEMMATMSSVNDELPSFTKDAAKRVSTLLLKKEQVKIVNHKKPWRVIQGPFGSGKSLILKAIAKQLHTLCDESTKTDIFYICFDPYSLLEIQVGKAFRGLVSVNIQEAASSLGFRVEDLLTPIKPRVNIAELFDGLCREGRVSHFLVDEFPSHIVDESYCTRLKKTLENKLKDSNVVIALQSIGRDGEILKNGRKVPIPRETLHKSGMTILPPLTESMRMCSNLYELVKIAQDCITESEVLLGSSSKLQRDVSKSTSIKGADSQRIDENVTGSSDGNSKIVLTESSDLATADTQPINKDETQKSINTAKLHDAQAFPRIYREKFSLMERESSKKILKERFVYQRGNSGHNVESGAPPRIIYLNNDFTLDSAFSGNVLGKVLEMCIDDQHQCTIICNNIDEAVITKYALREADTTEYIKYLQDEYPSREVKEEILEKLEDGQSVLLTDYRGFRGCETEHCITFVEEDSESANHLVLEIISRGIAKIDIIVLPASSYISRNSTTSFSNVLHEWKKRENLVQVETVFVKEERTIVSIEPFGSYELEFDEIQDEKIFEEIKQSLLKPRFTSEEVNRNLGLAAEKVISEYSQSQPLRAVEQTPQLDLTDNAAPMELDKMSPDTSKKSTTTRKRLSDERISQENVKRKQYDKDDDTNQQDENVGINRGLEELSDFKRITTNQWLKLPKNWIRKANVAGYVCDVKTKIKSENGNIYFDILFKESSYKLTIRVMEKSMERYVFLRAMETKTPIFLRNLSVAKDNRRLFFNKFSDLYICSGPFPFKPINENKILAIHEVKKLRPFCIFDVIGSVKWEPGPMEVIIKNGPVKDLRKGLLVDHNNHMIGITVWGKKFIDSIEENELYHFHNITTRSWNGQLHVENEKESQCTKYLEK